MKNANDSRALAYVRRPARLSVVTGLLIGAAHFAALHAAPTYYVYKGVDPYNRGTMNVTLTAVAGVANTYSVQGSISLPGAVPSFNIPSPICTLWANQLVGATLTATACDLPPGAVSYQPSGISGTLSGTLGSASSSIYVTTGYLYFGSAGFVTFQFTLDYAGGSTSTSGSGSGSTSGSTSGSAGHSSGGAPKPASMHMTGATGFGYTSVILTLNFALQPNNTTYSVSGTILVRREVLVGFNWELEPTTLTVSGVLTPGVEGRLAVSGAAAGEQSGVQRNHRRQLCELQQFPERDSRARNHGTVYQCFRMSQAGPDVPQHGEAAFE